MSVVPELLDLNLRALSRLAVTKEGSLACVDAKVVPLLLEVLRMEKQATKMLLASESGAEAGDTQAGQSRLGLAIKKEQQQQQQEERGAKAKSLGSSKSGSVAKGSLNEAKNSRARSSNNGFGSSNAGSVRSNESHAGKKVLAPELAAAPLRAYLQHINNGSLAGGTSPTGFPSCSGSSISDCRGSSSSSAGGTAQILHELWQQPGAADGFEGQLALWCLLNMSRFRTTQVPICRHGLYTLIGVVRGFADVTRRRVAAAVLEHVSGHKDNTTMIYKAELRMKQRCILEQAGMAKVFRQPAADSATTAAGTAGVTLAEVTTGAGVNGSGEGDSAAVQMQSAEAAPVLMSNIAPRRGIVRILDGGSSSFMLPAGAQNATAGGGGALPGLGLLGVSGAYGQPSMASLSQLPAGQASLMSLSVATAGATTAACDGVLGTAGNAAGVPKLKLGPKFREEAAEGAIDVAILGSSRAAGVRAANSGRRVSADTQQAAYFINKATPRLHKVGGEASRTSCFLPSTAEEGQAAGAAGNGSGAARLSAAVLDSLSGSPPASARLSNAVGSVSVLSVPGLQLGGSSTAAGEARNSMSGVALGPAAATMAAAAGPTSLGSKSAAGGTVADKQGIGGAGGDARANFLRWLAEFEGSWDGTFASAAGGVASSSGALPAYMNADGGVRATKAGGATLAGAWAATFAGGAPGESIIGATLLIFMYYNRS
jgi:hypothetical protein